jgi:hypothetical protein
VGVVVFESCTHVPHRQPWTEYMAHASLVVHVSPSAQPGCELAAFTSHFCPSVLLREMVVVDVVVVVVVVAG